MPVGMPVAVPETVVSLTTQASNVVVNPRVTSPQSQPVLSGYLSGATMRQTNVTDGEPVSSVAVTLTVYVATVVGVPAISPVDELIDSPAGSPVALQLSGPLPPLCGTSSRTGTPLVVVWSPG